MSGPGEIEYDENGRLFIRGESPPEGFNSLWDDNDELIDTEEVADAE